MACPPAFSRARGLRKSQILVIICWVFTILLALPSVHGVRLTVNQKQQQERDEEDESGGRFRSNTIASKLRGETRQGDHRSPGRRGLKGMDMGMDKMGRNQLAFRNGDRDPTNPQDCYAHVYGNFGPVISLVGRGIPSNARNVPGTRRLDQRRRLQMDNGEVGIIRRGYGTGSLGRRLYVPPDQFFPQVNVPGDCTFEVTRPSAPSQPRTQPPVTIPTRPPIVPTVVSASPSNQPSEPPSASPTISNAPSLSANPSSLPTLSNQPSVSSAPTSVRGTTVIRVIDAIISYAPLFNRRIGPPTQDEYDGVIAQTDRFYSDIMSTFFSSTFRSVAITLELPIFDATQVPTSSTDIKYPNTILIQLSYTFTDKTDRGFLPDAETVLAVMDDANYQAYVQSYVWASLPETSLFRGTNQVSYTGSAPTPEPR